MRRSDVVFFLSGAAALAYEATWARLLARLVGGDARGLALVLAVFMGGLGLGSRLFARAAHTSAAPERLFALVTAAVGLWAALSPWMLAGLSPAGGALGGAGLACLVLLVPTVGMGATFPLMGRLTIADAADSGRATSAFYGANTLGGAAGALVGPLVLVPLLGFTLSLSAAAALDLAAAGLALLWLRAPAAPDAAPPARAASPPPPERARAAQAAAAAAERAGAPGRGVALLAAVGLAGAASLALEVVLQRVLVTVTGASVYALAIVLAVFLGGLGLGSRLTARPPAAGARGVRLTAGADTLFGALALAPALALAGVALLRLQLGEADLFGGLANRMPAGAGVGALWASHVLFAALALLPPTLAFGAALPSGVAALVAARPGARREPLLGAAYAANTLGALVGSLAAGFVLLPRLGPRLAVCAALVPAVLAAALAARGASRRLVRLAPALALATALLGWLALRPAGGAQDAVLVQAFGPHAAVTVEESRPADGGAPVRSLRVNGKVVATTAPVDLRLQRLLAYLPGALHGAVESALVVGLGTGMTAGALLDLPTLETLRVVEIAPAVERGARAFAAWNGDLLDDPRTSVEIADGHWVLRVEERRYDLVTADPIHPWTRGSSDLYALEHFRAMRARLAPGGVASQWLPLYQLSLTDVRTVVATWCASFEHVSAWLTAYDLVLVGAETELAGPEALAGLDLRARFGPALAAHAGEAGIHSGCELAALLAADDAALRAFAAGVPPMREDRPVLEFRAPLSYLAGYSVEALRWAGRPAVVAELPVACRPRARELRALLATFLDELPSGLSRAAERYGRALLALPPAGG